jgi:hypothetical protein
MLVLLLVMGLTVVVVLSIFKEFMSDRMMTKAALASRSFSGFFNRQSALLPMALGLGCWVEEGTACSCWPTIKA